MVKRRRLTLEEYEKMRAKAEPWFQLALDIALLTLQRREDIVNLTTSNLRDGYLWVEQGKTGRRLRIKYAGTRLERLLLPFATEDQDSDQRLIRKTKGRARRGISGDIIERGFVKAWELAIGPRQPGDPTFHELRALGARLYEDRGIDPQLLLGHLDPRNTRLYLDRHKVQWVDVDLPQ